MQSPEARPHYCTETDFDVFRCERSFGQMRMSLAGNGARFVSLLLNYLRDTIQDGTVFFTFDRKGRSAPQLRIFRRVR